MKISCDIFPLLIYNSSKSLWYAFLFFSLIYFNWRIIAFQYCGGFPHTFTWISHRYTCVPSILNPPDTSLTPHPSGLSQSTNFGCLASYMELVLAICSAYGNVHVSMWISQITPPSPSPRVQKSVLYMCLFCCLVYRVVVTVSLNSI